MSFDSLIVKLSAISLQASKFTKNELHTYFSTILAMRGLFFRWGASFLNGGWGRQVLMGGISFGGKGGFEKNCKMGAAPHAPTMGKPEKNLS